MSRELFVIKRDYRSELFVLKEDWHSEFFMIEGIVARQGLLENMGLVHKVFMLEGDCSSS